MRNNLKSQGVKHLDSCRLRVEQAMRDVDNPRLQRAEGRQLGEFERRAAGRAEAAAAPPAAAPPAAAPEALEAPATPDAGDNDMDADAREAGRALDADGMYESRYDANGDAVMAMRVGPAAVVELYSPPRVTMTLPAGTGLVAGSTFDLHADVDGGEVGLREAAGPQARVGAHPRGGAVPGHRLASMHHVQHASKPQHLEGQR